eukprot:scaffold18046_cov63-Phaeocystis_antarctica.AAC.3
MPKVQPPRARSFSCTMTTLAPPMARTTRSSSASRLPASPRYVWSLRYSRKCVTLISAPPAVTSSSRPIPAAKSAATAIAPGLCGEAYSTGRGCDSAIVSRCSSPGMNRSMWFLASDSFSMSKERECRCEKLPRLPSRGQLSSSCSARYDAAHTLAVFCAKDGKAQLVWALVFPDRLEGHVGGEVRCRVVHEGDRLALGHGAACLAQAVDRLEVALGDEDHHAGRRLDILLERIDRLEVVDVEEDGGVRQQHLELPLDGGALVLPRPPDVGEEQVPAVALLQRQVGHLLGGDRPDQRLARLSDELVERDEGRQCQRAHDRRDHADGEEPGIEDVALTQVDGEHGVHCLGQQAHLDMCGYGLGRHAHLEDDREEEDGGEREAARQGEVVVRGALEGHGHAGEQHVHEGEEEGGDQLVDGAGPH